MKKGLETKMDTATGASSTSMATERSSMPVTLTMRGQRSKRTMPQGGHPVSKVTRCPDVWSDILRVFPGAKVIVVKRPLACQHCSGESVPKWRCRGKVVGRTWPDGRRESACHYCGRALE